MKVLSVQVLALGFLKWAIAGADAGTVQSELVSDKFPVLW